MEKRKALVVASVPSFIAGFEINDIVILQNKGYEVHVATNFDRDVKDDRIKRLDELNIIKHSIPFERKPINISNAVSYKIVKKLLADEEFDLVHCHTPAVGVILRLAARPYRKQGMKVFYTAHGFHFYTGAPLKNWLIYYPVEWLCSWWTDTLITINKEDFERARKHFHAGRIEYIPGVGVDTEKFALCKVDKKAKRLELGVKEDDFLLLSVGELSDRKNQKVVINALSKINAEGNIDNIIYLVVGEGEKEEELKKLVEKSQLQQHVKFLGFRNDIDELCEIVNCFVHPSVREGLGIAPLEAMAAGLPLISANVNGIKDYTEDGISGYCIAPTDADAMASAISRMHDDDKFREKCGTNNYRKAKTFDIRNTDEIMKKVYRGGYNHLLSVAIRQAKREELGISFDDFTIISVGELNTNKNHQVIIRTLPNLPENVKYILVGEGVLGERLKQLAADIGVRKRVFFTGLRTDVKELLYTADCFAFPSIREGLGVAALEGMAAGLPVVGHDIGGIKDYVIDGETGWLCVKNTVDEYIRNIQRCMIDVNIYKQSKNDVFVAKNFDSQVTNRIMRKCYME